MSNAKTVEGFDIPFRELTDVEKNSEVTLERFQDWHYAVGEDFCDQVGGINGLILGGWLMAEYPSKSLEILSVLNREGARCNAQPLMDLSMYENDDDGDQFYSDFARFVNLTGNLKRRTNEILTIVTEYYRE